MNDTGSIPKPSAPILTSRQREVLSFIAHSVRVQSYPPSLAEIADRIGVHQPKTAQFHVDALIDKGFLVRDSGVWRGLRVLQDPHE